MENKTKKTEPLSLAALFAGLAATGLYFLSFSFHAVIPVWVAVTVVSLVLPTIAKHRRLSGGRQGKPAEIIALVFAGLAFYMVIFALTEVSLYVGYLGWIVMGIVYRLVT